MKGRYYIAGPMAGMPGGNFDAFRAAASELRRYDFEVVSPVELNEADGESAALDPGHPRRGEFLRRDLTVVLDPATDAVVVLNGWHASEGARLEVAVAEAVGKPVLGPYPSLKPLEQGCEESVLQEANRIVSGSRAAAYGHPADHSSLVARLWHAAFGWEVDGFRVNLAMVLFKLARSVVAPRHRDSLVDQAGYVRTAEAVLAREGVPRMRDLG